jgi:hypothetical protein
MDIVDAEGTPPAPIALVSPGFDAVLRLLDEALTELGHEENKSARLMAALTVATGALVTGFFAGRWNPVNLPPAGAALWWMGALTVLSALALVGTAATYGGRPGLRSPSPGAARDPAALHQWATALVGRPEEDPAARLWRARQTIGVKRNLVRAGLVAMASGLGLCVAGGFLPL